MVRHMRGSGPLDQEETNLVSFYLASISDCSKRTIIRACKKRKKIRGRNACIDEYLQLKSPERHVLVSL